MKRQWVLLAAAGMVCASVFSAFAYNGRNVNGKAVSVQWRFTKWFYSGGNCCECNESQSYDGSICVYTIANAVVTRADTIYRREQGLAQYANFDLTGTRVAFFRKGTAPQGPNGAGNCVSVNDGKSYISVILTNGAGLRNLCEIQNAPGRDQALDWPAGEWIYYVQPKTPTQASAAGGGGNTNSVDIWKVNATTGVTQRVCDFSAGGDNHCQFWRRFSLDVSATHMAAQSSSFYGCSDDGSFSGGNGLWNFPPNNCSLSAGFICSHPACNIAVSPSGALVGTYFAGSHNELFINGTNPAQPHPDGFLGRCGIDIASPTLSELTTWAGENVGSGCEHIAWAVNSDKWALQEVGWVGHADQLAFGSNQVVCNWVDHVAIRLSKNTPSALTSNNEPSGIAWNNATGDMWIDDPVNNPNGTKYEDLQGVWHEAPGATAVRNPAAVEHSVAMDALTAMVAGREMLVRAPIGVVSTVSVTDLRGATVLKSAATGDTRVSLQAVPAGSYVVTLRSGATVKSMKTVLR